MSIKEVETKKVIVPKKMIYRNSLFRITDIDPKYVIRKYTVRLVDGKIDSVYLDSIHPNSDPDTNEFCIPFELRNLPLNEQSIEYIEHMINIFNLDNCYFTPWGEIKYESIGVEKWLKIGKERKETDVFSNSPKLGLISRFIEDKIKSIFDKGRILPQQRKKGKVDDDFK